MNGSGRLTETEYVIFLRKLRNYYGTLTDKRNSCVFLKRNTKIRLQMNGNLTLETMHLSLYYPPLMQWRWNEFESGGTGSVGKWGAPVRHKKP